jgi:hypothetical protein
MVSEGAPGRALFRLELVGRKEVFAAARREARSVRSILLRVPELATTGGEYRPQSKSRKPGREDIGG